MENSQIEGCTVWGKWSLFFVDGQCTHLGDFRWATLAAPARRSTTPAADERRGGRRDDESTHSGARDDRRAHRSGSDRPGPGRRSSCSPCKLLRSKAGLEGGWPRRHQGANDPLRGRQDESGVHAEVQAPRPGAAQRSCGPGEGAQADRRRGDRGAGELRSGDESARS